MYDAMNSEQSILILQGEKSQFDELLPEIEKFNVEYLIVNTVFTIIIKAYNVITKLRSVL